MFAISLARLIESWIASFVVSFVFLMVGFAHTEYSMLFIFIIPSLIFLGMLGYTVVWRDRARSNRHEVEKMKMDKLGEPPGL